MKNSVWGGELLSVIGMACFIPCKEVSKSSDQIMGKINVHLDAVVKLDGLLGDVNLVVEGCPARLAHTADEVKLTH